MCTGRIELSAPAPFPVICGRPECHDGVGHERLVAPVLVERPGWLSVVDVVTATGLAQGVVTGVLARMRRRGWVESRRVPVARRVRGRRVYRLTRAGEPMARMLIGRTTGLATVAVSVGAAR